MKIALVGVLLIGTSFLVYITGGIKYVYSHTMYLAILMGAYGFGWPGGVVSGVIGGILLGPYMPVDVLTGEMQTTLNWVFRTGWFVAFGGLVGALTHTLRKRLHRLKWALAHHPMTGLT